MKQEIIETQYTSTHDIYNDHSVDRLIAERDRIYQKLSDKYPSCSIHISAIGESYSRYVLTVFRAVIKPL